jgi:O-antigen ligase
MSEFMGERRLSRVIDGLRNGEIADWLVVAVAASLPWSTSATAILIVLWLIAVLSKLDVASIQGEVMTAAGGLPVLLWGLAAIGMLWADVGWDERIQDLRGFHKLLLIPLLLAQFRRSGWAKRSILAFFVSALALLVVSSLTFSPGLWGREKADVGIPVKDYIAQSGIFAVCALGLLGQAIELWRTRCVKLALAAILTATSFFASILYVATARTTLVVIAVLFLLLGIRQFRWKGLLAVGLLGGLLASLSWISSPYLRGRVIHMIEEVQDYGVGDATTSIGMRLAFWKKSMEFIGTAPLVGHGTGTIEPLFRRSAGDDSSAPAVITGNPHNQVLAVAIPLGFIGTIALIAMWIAHLALFGDVTLMSWFGLIVVVANIVSSLFNTHLFDFTQGWLYVFGVGIAGGTLRGQMNDKNIDVQRDMTQPSLIISLASRWHRWLRPDAFR